MRSAFWASPTGDAHITVTAPCLFVIGELEPSNLGIGNERNPSPTSPTGTYLCFHLSRMIADHPRNLGRVGKIGTLPILQICPLPSQTIGDICDSEFSLVWDSRETIKSPIVWDFSDLWKPGLTLLGQRIQGKKLNKFKTVLAMTEKLSDLS